MRKTTWEEKRIEHLEAILKQTQKELEEANHEINRLVLELSQHKTFIRTIPEVV